MAGRPRAIDDLDVALSTEIDTRPELAGQLLGVVKRADFERAVQGIVDDVDVLVRFCELASRCCRRP